MSGTAGTEHKFVFHRANDDVAVAIEDVTVGPALARSLDSGQLVELTVIEDVPLAHKVALRDKATGESVIEYGEPIGRATVSILAGSHVHVHNVESLRWNRGDR